MQDEPKGAFDVHLSLSAASDRDCCSSEAQQSGHFSNSLERSGVSHAKRAAASGERRNSKLWRARVGGKKVEIKPRSSQSKLSKPKMI